MIDLRRLKLALLGVLICTSHGTAWAQSAQATLPWVVVLSTGGTIAGRGGSSTSLTEYKSGSILGSELVDAVPEIKQHARVRVEQIANLGSTNISTAIWLKLAARINAIFNEEPEIAGVRERLPPFAVVEHHCLPLQRETLRLEQPGIFAEPHRRRDGSRIRRREQPREQ